MLSYKISTDSGEKKLIIIFDPGENSFFSVIRCSCLAKAKLLISACTHLVNYLYSLCIFTFTELHRGKKFHFNKDCRNAVQGQRTDQKAFFHNH